ncbi:response regulator transcription factor [Nitrincola schmidtii]|uniref:response regulator transcription factor n=1 Tax=Nitrincola schmidtii TaxID=1730894 RepID=UPI00124E259C|nr:response regulator transcription factor [Nitrincola schmidtii]
MIKTIVNHQLSKTQVLLVEDDADLRDALAEYLELNGCSVIAVGTGMAFYQALARGDTFHVAIIDLGLPDQPGHVLAQYARQNTRMSIIIITANDSIENRIETYHTGADLLLSKPLDSRELLAAVVAMNRRYLERYGHEPVGENTTGMLWQLNRARRQLTSPTGTVFALSPHETCTFELFCAAGTHTVARSQLLERIYGRDDESTQRALDNMIRRLRQKITEGSDLPPPILTAYGVGYSFSEPLHVL